MSALPIKCDDVVLRRYESDTSASYGSGYITGKKYDKRGSDNPSARRRDRESAACMPDRTKRYGEVDLRELVSNSQADARKVDQMDRQDENEQPGARVEKRYRSGGYDMHEGDLKSSYQSFLLVTNTETALQSAGGDDYANATLSVQNMSSSNATGAGKRTKDADKSSDAVHYPPVFSSAAPPVMMTLSQQYVQIPGKRTSRAVASMLAEKIEEEKLFFKPLISDYRFKEKREDFLTEMMNDQSRRQIKKQAYKKTRATPSQKPRNSPRKNHVKYDERDSVPFHERSMNAFQEKNKKIQEHDRNANRPKTILPMAQSVRDFSEAHHRMADHLSSKRQEKLRHTMDSERQLRERSKMHAPSYSMAEKKLLKELAVAFGAVAGLDTGASTDANQNNSETSDASPRRGRSRQPARIGRIASSAIRSKSSDTSTLLKPFSFSMARTVDPPAPPVPSTAPPKPVDPMATITHEQAYHVLRALGLLRGHESAPPRSSSAFSNVRRKSMGTSLTPRSSSNSPAGPSPSTHSRRTSFDMDDSRSDDPLDGEDHARGPLPSLLLHLLDPNATGKVAYCYLQDLVKQIHETEDEKRRRASRTPSPSGRSVDKQDDKSWGRQSKEQDSKSDARHRLSLSRRRSSSRGSISLSSPAPTSPANSGSSQSSSSSSSSHSSTASWSLKARKSSASATSPSSSLDFTDADAGGLSDVSPVRCQLWSQGREQIIHNSNDSLPDKQQIQLQKFLRQMRINRLSHRGSSRKSTPSELSPTPSTESSPSINNSKHKNKRARSTSRSKSPGRQSAPTSARSSSLRNTRARSLSPSTGRRRVRSPSASFRRRVDMMMEKRAQHKQQLEQQRKQKEEEELKDCPFVPESFTRKSSPNKKKSAKKMSVKPTTDTSSSYAKSLTPKAQQFYNRLYKQHEVHARRREKLQQQQQKEEEEKMQSLPFRPKLNTNVAARPVVDTGSHKKSSSVKSPRARKGTSTTNDTTAATDTFYVLEADSNVSSRAATALSFATSAQLSTDRWASHTMIASPVVVGSPIYVPSPTSFSFATTAENTAANSRAATPAPLVAESSSPLLQSTVVEFDLLNRPHWDHPSPSTFDASFLAETQVHQPGPKTEGTHKASKKKKKKPAKGANELVMGYQETINRMRSAQKRNTTESSGGSSSSSSFRRTSSKSKRGAAKLTARRQHKELDVKAAPTSRFTGYERRFVAETQRNSSAKLQQESIIARRHGTTSPGAMSQISDRLDILFTHTSDSESILATLLDAESAAARASHIRRQLAFNASYESSFSMQTEPERLPQATRAIPFSIETVQSHTSDTATMKVVSPLASLSASEVTAAHLYTNERMEPKTNSPDALKKVEGLATIQHKLESPISDENGANSGQSEAQGDPSRSAGNPGTTGSSSAAFLVPSGPSRSPWALSSSPLSSSLGGNDRRRVTLHVDVKLGPDYFERITVREGQTSVASLLVSGFRNCYPFIHAQRIKKLFGATNRHHSFLMFCRRQSARARYGLFFPTRT